MNHPNLWFWQIKTPTFSCKGFKHAVDARDAATRAMTEELTDGKLIGMAIGFPIESLAEIPANDLEHYVQTFGETTVEVRLARCPSQTRHEDDIAGCGSTSVEAGDDGIVDCLNCGIFFDPVTAY